MLSKTDNGAQSPAVMLKPGHASVVMSFALSTAIHSHVKACEINLSSSDESVFNSGALVMNSEGQSVKNKGWGMILSPDIRIF